MKHGDINVVEKYDNFYNTPPGETKPGEITPTHLLNVLHFGPLHFGTRLVNFCSILYLKP